MRIDEAAVQVMRERRVSFAWYGNPDLLHEIADLAGHKQTHPLNTIGAVLSCLSKSPKFKRSGQIEHMGRKYPIFALADPTTGAAR